MWVWAEVGRQINSGWKWIIANKFKLKTVFALFTVSDCWVRGISYADCRAINNILLWWGRVCLLAWHLGFNSGGKKKKSHICMILLTQAIWREYRWEMFPPFSHNLLQQQCMATQWPWLITHSSSVCILITQPSLCVCSVHVAPTRVLDCEKEFEMKYFNSRVVHAASVRACLCIDMYAYDVRDMQINRISLHVASGIYYHHSF